MSPRNAIDLAAGFAPCVNCGERIAWVDTSAKEGPARGGQWVHVKLPPTVHPAAPVFTEIELVKR